MSTPKKQKLISNSKELKSVNENLYDEFYIQELEERLETDPMLSSAFFGTLGSETDVSQDFDSRRLCGEFSFCFINIKR